jgi:hypothetical protein
LGSGSRDEQAAVPEYGMIAVLPWEGDVGKGDLSSHSENGSLFPLILFSLTPPPVEL